MGKALEWLINLREKPRATRTPKRLQSGEPIRATSISDISCTRDPVAAMEGAARREWKPPRQLVAAVEAEAEVSQSEAVEALRRHAGDVVSAIEELLGDATADSLE